MSEEEQEVVEQAIKIIKASIAIPCTACRYCIDDCPKKIVIPDYFAVYNNLKRFGGPQRMVASTYYANLTQIHGKASERIIENLGASEVELIEEEFSSLDEALN